MRNLVIAAVLASALATPALAQSYDPIYGTGNTIFPPGAPNVSAPVVAPYATDNVGPYAYAPAPHARIVHHRMVRHARAAHARHAEMR